MTLKTYQRIKLGLVVVLAFIFGQAIIFKNWLVPVALIVVASLVLIYLRRQVKEIIADERDYATAGKSASLAIQIFSWIAVIVMFVLYSLKDHNPAYEPIAITLAYSVCILMLIYSVLFRYYNKIKLVEKKRLFFVFAFVLLLFVVVFTLRLFSGEDNWICKDGQWIKHGQPDRPMPTVSCEK